MADPLDIFSLSASDFNAYLQEAAQYSAPSQIDFLRNEYKKRNFFGGLLDTVGEAGLEGKNVSSMLPIAGPAGMSLFDAAKGGKLQTRFKDYITDAIGAIIGAVENPGLAAKGLLTDNEMMDASMQTASAAMLGGGVAVNAARPSGDGLLASNMPAMKSQSLPEPRNQAEANAKAILELRAQGRANEVTNDMMSAADPQYMFNNTPLDMSENARMARASELGFDSDNASYHGTKTAELNRFDPEFIKQGLGGKVVYSTDTPQIASRYAGSDMPYDIPSGSGVLPLLLRGDRKAMPASDLAKGESKYFDNVQNNIQTAKDEGFAGMDLQTSDPSGARVLTTFSPANIRSRFARFDPEFSDLSNLSAANANASVGALVLSQHARAKPELADILAQNGVDPANINAAPIQRVQAALETATARQILDPRSANAILQGFARPELEDFYANASKSAGAAGLLASDAAANAKPQLGGEVGLLGPSFVTTGPDLLAKNQARAKNDANVLAYPGLPYAGTLVQGRGILDDLEIKGFEAGDTTSARLTDIADLKGKTILPVVGDLTSDRIITSVNDITLPDPVKLQAGGQFMDKGDQLWASDKGPMSGKLSVAKQVNDPIYMHMAMGAKSGDFAKHSGAVLSEMFKAVDLSKAQMKRIAQHIRSTSLKRGDKQVTPFTDFKNFTDPSYIGEYLANLKAGGNRETFMKVLEKKTAQDLGVPDIGALRLAVTNPDLFATDFLNMGYRFGYPDVEKGLLSTDPSIHTTYDTLINKKPGTSSMTLGVDIPYTIMMRDVAAQRRSANSGGLLQGMPADYKSFEMRPSNVQKIDDQLIEEASRFKEIQQTQGRKAALDYARRLIGN